MSKLGDFVPADQRLIMPAGPTIDRGRGCWNCLHWDVDGAKERWNGQRTQLLTIAMRHKLEGNDARAEGLAKIVATTDQGVTQGTFGLCKKGWNFPSDPPPDPKPLIQYQNLCHKWDGRDGASLATSGHPIDLLPHELTELYAPKPDPKLVAAAKAEAEAARAKKDAP